VQNFGTCVWRTAAQWQNPIFPTSKHVFPRDFAMSLRFLPYRSSQLSTQITGDVPFPQDGPPKFTQLSTQIEKIHKFVEEDSCSTNVKLSSMACVSTVSGGFWPAAALSQGEKRVQYHFSRDRPRFGSSPAALRAPVVAPSGYFSRT